MTVVTTFNEVPINSSNNLETILFYSVWILGILSLTALFRHVIKIK